MVNILKTVMHKVESSHKQLGNGTRDMEILRKNQKEILYIKHTIARMKNVFDEIISRELKKRISGLEGIPREPSKTVKSKKTDWGKKTQNIQRLCSNNQRYNIQVV